MWKSLRVASFQIDIYKCEFLSLKSNIQNFYRRFIKSFFKIAKSLNTFVKKNIVFVWDSACNVIFRKFKNRVLKTSILRHFERKKQCYLKIDFSNIVKKKVLLQKQNDDLFYFIAFFFKNMSSVNAITKYMTKSY